MKASSRRLLSLGKRLHELFDRWRGLDSEFLVATAIVATDVMASTLVPSERAGALEDYLAICRAEFAHACLIADRVDQATLSSIPTDLVH